MPFKSERQRRWMFANKPAMAKRWSSEQKKRRRYRQKRKKKKS